MQQENPSVSEALDSFLKQLNINYAKDLTSRFSVEMEAQIMVDPGDGEAVEGMRNTWATDSTEFGYYRFHHIRIPKNSMSDPFWNDPPIQFPLGRHIECCGMTGWNWMHRKSLWVGFDIDSITGHAAGVGIKEEEMIEVRKRACSLPYLQVRRSTGGLGTHVYGYFDPDDLPETENHHVHSALARCVLGMMERDTGFDFRGNMDVLGGNMWIWHRKINEHNRGLEIIKDYEDFIPPLPSNWRDNLDVITGKSSKVVVRGVGKNDYDSFESQAAARVKVDIDDTHKQIEERIEKLGYSIIWVPDHHCWQTHTKAFQDLLDEWPEDYQGIYRTLSEGSDKGKPNCFAFPLKGGGMRITRFGRGAREDETWHQDGSDWTWTYFNKPPSLREVAAIYGGSEDPDGKGWVFTNFIDAGRVVYALGDRLPLSEGWLEQNGEAPGRNIVLRSNKNDQLVMEMDKLKDEKAPQGWIEKGRKYIKLIRVSTEPMKDEEEINLDDRIRALVDTNQQFAHWVILNEDGEWISHSKDNVRSALKVWSPENAEELLGQLIIKNWTVVNVPFQPEYLGDRRWNRNAPQFAVSPAESGTPHPHWDMVLSHTGQDLDDVVTENQWCREVGINSGADYLMYWIAFMFRDPYGKLPYLFFYGPQNSGKSILHQAISLLMTRGVQLAKSALEDERFNGELQGSVLCVVEEVDLSKQRSQAYNKIKEWSDGEDILIHPKGKQPYMIKNTTHWMHMTNNKDYCPIFPGDTRIVMLYVPMPDGLEIPRDTLLQFLSDEAPAFLRTILDLKLPPPPTRLRLPIICTESKREAERASESLVARFIEDKCHVFPGGIVKFSDFYNAMEDWMTNEQAALWPYNKVADEFRTQNYGSVVFGRHFNNVACLGNISLTPRVPGKDYGGRWVRRKKRLEQERFEEDA